MVDKGYITVKTHNIGFDRISKNIQLPFDTTTSLRRGFFF